jgi:hypothetical protein
MWVSGKDTDLARPGKRQRNRVIDVYVYYWIFGEEEPRMRIEPKCVGLDAEAQMNTRGARPSNLENSIFGSCLAIFLLSKPSTTVKEQC